MSIINFENCPVTVGGINVFANNINITQNLPTQPINSLGIYGAGPSYPLEPPQGNVAIDFYISGAQDVTHFTNLKKTGYADDLGNFLDVQVGPFSVNKGVLASYELTASPNELITASIGIDYYGAFESGVVPDQQFATGSLAHGGFSTGDFALLGFSNGSFGYSYSLSQSFRPIRKLGESLPTVVLWTDGTETLNLEGYNLPVSLTGTYSANSSNWFFPTSGGVQLDIKNVCSTEYTKLGVTGLLASRSITVAEDNVVNGALEITNPL